MRLDTTAISAPPATPATTQPEAAEQEHGRAAMIRLATSSQHRDAETRGFITRLMGGELSLEAYTSYLAQYAYVYRALEARAARADDPELIADARLRRVASIESDLRELGVEDLEAEHPALAATTAYVERLIEAADDLPAYVAHHYTRYLGDLSGGQAIAALVARHYGASEVQLNFYRFEGIDSPVVFKRAYREALDQLAFTEAQDQRLVAEAQLAFELNSAIFEALGARL